MSKLKKLSKSDNLPKFNTKKAELSFLISNIRIIFNRLRLAFITALIFQNFDLKYYI